MMSDNRFLEIRTYKLRPGTRAEFDRRVITETFTPQTKKYEGRVVAEKL